MPHRSRRRRRRRRQTILLSIGALFVVGLAIAVAGLRDVLAARNRLNSARTTLDQALSRPSDLQTPAGRTATIQQLDFARGSVVTARTILNASLALKVARFVPFATTQRRGLFRLVNDSETALDAGQTLLTNIDQLAANGKVASAQVPLSSLATLESDVRDASARIAPLSRSSAHLIGPLGQARRDFDTLARSTATRLQNDADALKVAQTFTGSAGLRRYFVAVENAAEERDQGSVLSFALVTFDHGHVMVDTHGSVLNPVNVPGRGTTSLVLTKPAPVPIPSGTEAVFGSLLPTQLWQSVNATADFAYSGRAMQAMYQQATGQTVDGVIGLDVPALSALLSVVGPVIVPGITQPVTAANATQVLMHDFYSAFPPGQALARHELLDQVVDQVVSRLSAGTFDPVPLAQNLATATAGGHVQVWSADPSEQTLLERTGLAGDPAAAAADRTFHVAVENRNATKMDYFIKPSIDQQVTVSKSGTATVHTTVTVRNTAPVGAAPSEQLGPDGYGTTQPGEYWAWVLLWGPSHANQPHSVSESGLRLSQTVLDRIYAGQSKQVSFDTVIPNAVRSDGTLDLRYVPQPRLEAPTLSVTVHATGWTIKSAPTWSGPWARSMTLTWKLEH